MAPHSSTFAWKIPWMGEPGRLQSTGSRRVRHDWATSLSHFTFMHWRRKWQPTPVFLPGESQGWGRIESDTTEVTQQQQQQRWVFFAALWHSPIVESGGYSLLGFLQLQRAGATFPCRAQNLGTCEGSVVMAQGLSYPVACGILPIRDRTRVASISRDRTRVACISREILNHQITREAPIFSTFLLNYS